MVAISVVVVDDHDRLREALVFMIGMDDRFAVKAAAQDGYEAIALAEQLQPDVILLDVSMPKLDGIAALPMVRAVSPRSVVFLHTADADGEIVRTAESNGAGWIEKSTPLDVLLERLAAAVG